MILFSILAITPDWVMSSAYARIPDIGKHFSTLVKPQGSVLWYLAAFLFFPSAPLLGVVFWHQLSFMLP